MAIRFTAPPTPREFRVGDTVTASGKPDIKPGMVIVAVSRRYKAGRTHAAMKPWEAEGISRRTWYRNQAKAKKA